MLNRSVSIFILLIASVIVFAVTLHNAFASKFPQSKIEREIEEMGSIIGGEGIVLKTSRERPLSTKAKIGNVNKYLFKSSVDSLSFAPIITADVDSGVIITDWYYLDGKKNSQVKLNVSIKEQVISPEGIDVVAFERKKQGDVWGETIRNNKLANDIEKRILRKARDMYLKDIKK